MNIFKSVLTLVGLAVYSSINAQYVDSAFKLSPSKSIRVAANENYDKAGHIKRFFFGDHYRKEWATAADVEVFDIGSSEITPTKTGGGMQTKSLRLESKDGKEFVLRSINKDPSKALPQEFVGTFADDVLQDQISSSNPYAPLAVADLANAVGILHATPKIVFVVKSPALGAFNDEFGNTLCLLEERPTGNQENNPAFGFSKKIITSPKLFEKLLEDIDHQVDQRSFLKARLFDMLIGDWDRHEDQWVWASFKEGDLTIYKPIPRDRDQAFAKLDGLIPQIAARKSVIRKTQNFDFHLRDVAGLNINGNHIDRMFTTNLSREDWMNITEEIQKQLTNEKIEKALQKMPPEIYAISGESIVAKLKKRRDDLKEYASDYYDFLSDEVNVLGSNKKELFIVTRHENGSTHVVVKKIEKGGKASAPLFDRKFYFNETTSINIYGREGEDCFLIEGKARKAATLRIIGGNERDTIIDRSSVKGLRKKTRIFESGDDDELQIERESKIITTNDSVILKFNRFSNMYDKLMPKVAPGYNPDDGVYIGGGVSFKNYSFGKAPFASQQSIWGNVASATLAFNFQYDALFVNVFNKWNFEIQAKINAPNYVYSFYGLGNETTFDKNKSWSYYRARMNQILISPSINKKLGKYHQLELGLGLQSVKVEEKANKFITDSNTPSDVFDRKEFASINANYEFNTTNSLFYPTKGIKFSSLSELFQNLSQPGKKFIRFSSQLSSFNSFGRFTLAFRIGGATISNDDYQFYQSNSVGGLTNLRGFRRTRFNGKTSLYQNSEVRVRINSLNGYMIRGNYGILLFADHGRVWMPTEKSEKWHHGVGAGIWVLPYQKLAFSATFGLSDETKIAYIKAGFLF